MLVFAGFGWGKPVEINPKNFDNILISENWAALHFRYSLEELKTGEKTFGDRMQFLKFEKLGNSLKIVSSWIQ